MYDLTIVFLDGTKETYHLAEKHQVTFDKNGTPTSLMYKNYSFLHNVLLANVKEFYFNEEEYNNVKCNCSKCKETVK
jgi:hypothetical protein